MPGQSSVKLTTPTVRQAGGTFLCRNGRHTGTNHMATIINVSAAREATTEFADMLEPLSKASTQLKILTGRATAYEPQSAVAPHDRLARAIMHLVSGSRDLAHGID